MKEEHKGKARKPRGFAAMEPERQKEIASKGGKMAHLRGNAHEFTPDEAREAGRKGGQTVSKDREHMARIGRLGGEARGHGKHSKASPGIARGTPKGAPEEGAMGEGGV